MTGDGINHGTYGGYARRRRESAEVRAEERRQTAARTRAYVRLSRAYPTLYRALYEEELRRTT